MKFSKTEAFFPMRVQRKMFRDENSKKRFYEHFLKTSITIQP